MKTFVKIHKKPVTCTDIVNQGEQVTTTQYEKLFDKLGFGIPICTLLGCGVTASTIRTAQFGYVELLTHRIQYADAVAQSLLSAQDPNGAFYISYNKAGKLQSDRSFLYQLLDLFFNDKPIFHGKIITNAETMNDTLAFLLQYREARYACCLDTAYAGKTE